jgi:tetratricopeptide (TPR) repeat protein
MEQLVNIFIASSAEVSEEREKCILILNEINNSHNHLNLKPIEWEYDLPRGSYPNFKSIQKAINPLLEESHICIFIFNSKIGKYTKEEFELATKLNKKHIPFFKQGFSPKTRDEIAKWTELIDFKETLNDTVLYVDYTDTEHFELRLKDNLHLYLAQAFPPQTISANKPLPSDVAALLKILTEKQEEIDQLNSKSQLPNADIKQQLSDLERQKQELQDELNKSKEFQEQQAKDKQELELRLAPQIAKDDLKKQAFAAIKENKLEEAKELLKKSAEDSVKETATTFYEIGKVSKLQLQYREALHYFELAVKINPDDFDMNIQAGKMQSDLGFYNEAIAYFERALSIINNSSTENDNFLYVNNELGLAYKNIGNKTKALAFYEKSLKISIERYGNEHKYIATIYNNLGGLYFSENQYDKAIDFYKKSLKIYSGGNQETSVAITYNNLGTVYISKEEYDKAIDYFEKALVIETRHYGKEHPNIAIRYNNLGLSYSNKGDFIKAIEYYERALLMDRKYFGDDHPRIANRYNNLGMTYKKEGKYEKAIEYIEKAVLIFSKFLPLNHSSLLIVKKNLAIAKKDFKAQKNNQNTPN